MFYKKESSPVSYLVSFGLVAALMLLASVVTIFAQTDTVAQKEVAQTEVKTSEKQTVLQPVLADLKGIKLGMTVDEIKDKLGKAKVEDAAGFYYVFSDGETMQIGLDADKKVRMIATMYMGEDAKPPKYEDVFGANTVVEK